MNPIATQPIGEIGWRNAKNNASWHAKKAEPAQSAWAIEPGKDL